MGGCATKLRQAFKAEDEGEKQEPPIKVEEDKKAVEDAEEQFKDRVKEIVCEDENGNEIAVVDVIQGCKQRPSLSLLFKQEEEVKDGDGDGAESRKPKNETKGKQEPIFEAQEPETKRPKEEGQQQRRDHQQGNIIKEEQRDTSQQTKSDHVVASFAS